MYLGTECTLAISLLVVQAVRAAPATDNAAQGPRTGTGVNLPYLTILREV